MTKTLPTVLSHRVASPDLPVMMPLSLTVDGPIVWNFEFGSLGFVWNLGFGAWNFHDLH